MRLRGSGPNTVLTGAGDDIVEAYAKGRAAIDCGPGFDRVNIGFNRLVKTRNCELVKKLYKKRLTARSNVRPGFLGRTHAGADDGREGRTTKGLDHAPPLDCSLHRSAFAGVRRLGFGPRPVTAGPG